MVLQWVNEVDLAGSKVVLATSPPADADLGDLWLDTDGEAGASGGGPGGVHAYRGAAINVALPCQAGNNSVVNIDMPVKTAETGEIRCQASARIGVTNLVRDRGALAVFTISLLDATGVVLEADDFPWEQSLHASYSPSTPSPRTTLTMSFVSQGEYPPGDYKIRLVGRSEYVDNTGAGATVTRVAATTSVGQAVT